MKCEEALILMNSVIDGESTPQEEQVLRFHLNGCSQCRKAMLINRAISNCVSSLEEPEPPSGLLDAVNSRIASGDYDQSPVSGGSRFLSKWKIAAAIPFAAAALLLFQNLRGDNEHFSNEPSLAEEQTMDYTPAPVVAYSRPSSITTF